MVAGVLGLVDYGVGLGLEGGRSRGARCLAQLPMGPCKYVAYAWALKRVPYPYFEVYVCTIMIL